MPGLVSVPAAPAEPPERPRAVGVVGWIWLVLSVLFFIKAVVNLISWSVLESTSPRVFDAFANNVQVPFTGWMVKHGSVVFSIQAFFWILVVVAAANFLRLRPWAHTAIQVVCGLGLVYTVGFFFLWLGVWTRARAANPSPSPPSVVATLVLGIVLTLLLGVAFALMLRALRRPRVREAFGLTGQGEGTRPV